jgi:hypothetical protein
VNNQCDFVAGDNPAEMAASLAQAMREAKLI